MTPILLIDFGSTYTKVTAVDIDQPSLLGTAASYTTVETDVTEGLHQALTLLEQQALGVPVLLHGVVVVQVVLGQIGEDPHGEADPRHPLEVQGVGGDLHHHIGAAAD